MTTVNVTATMSMAENEFKALLTYNDLVFIIQTTVNMFTVLSITRKSFSVILNLVVTFTVVFFGHTQC